MLSDLINNEQSLRIAATLLLLSLTYVVYTILLRKRSITEDLPWPGVHKGLFGRWRTAFATKSRQEKLLQAFRDYSANDKPFVWQQFMGKPMVILPPSNLKWLIEQPFEDLNSHDFFNDTLALDISLTDAQVHEDPIQIKVVQHNVNRALSWTPGVLHNELRRCFDDQWGNSTEWHREIVWKTCVNMVARTVNRVFVGEELCRNGEYLQSVISYAEMFFQVGIMLRPWPKWLRKLFARQMTARQQKVFDGLSRLVGPIVEARKAEYERKLANEGYEYQQPSDALQWIIQHSYASQDVSNRSTARIIKRLMNMNFAAIHTTSTNAAHLMLDLASSKPEDDILGQIRNQIIDVHRECRGEWTKLHLGKLDLLDSALRETLRINSSEGGWTPSRAVHKASGLTLPSGLHAPKGTLICIPSYGIHHAKSDDFLYKPFRWANGSSGEERGRQATMTGPDYLVFGHGKDACPGRFFAVQEIKLMFVHLLMHYQLRPGQNRPGPVWYSDMPSADTTAIVEVRKIEPPSLD